MSWQASASIESLQQRAQLNAYIRDFFRQRMVMEVETPVLSKAAVDDANLQPMIAQACEQNVYLHTSPEYPMKRLLASGSGDIYQICKVFRDGEVGRRHNPEFTMLEYYRLGFDLKTLMDEVAALVGDFLQLQRRIDLSYAQALKQYAQIDVFDIGDEQLRDCVTEFVGADLALSRDECLDIIMSHVVEPCLPKDAMVFIFNYPASQAALAQTFEIDNGAQLAKRFELYVNGLELANGYQELTDVLEQKKRFANQAQRFKHTRPLDENFLQALEQGLPDCSGVAIGLDRILMLKQNTCDINDVLSFGFSQA
ncbi:EF-P lysine aminoacylase EpmA [Bermanella sp. WJH001]|uniref:EF-P lysine aminoacylase EpmA n=1 Tax=Bermanella sp. WJH001 TaxID=3048005 RepID=UPI0024BE49CE|nr:EF-P lysine aminoacylase EpmA [Bermanella sp. WJH001]MDJ1538585.1 EF-P lysine aminoacylase EpmA [Bermanella sp. WJH001]